jgi:hypothetical protein
MRNSFWFAQFFVLSSLAGLLLSGCGNVAAQSKDRITLNGQSPPRGTVITCVVLETGWKCDDGTSNGHPDVFDVVPTEWDGPDTTYKSELAAFDCGYNKTPSACEKVPVHHIGCASKSRFLLQSEDGRWHCLKLMP